MISFREVVAIEPEFVRVTTIGQYDFSELFPFLDRVRSLAEKEGRTQILIDSRALEGQMTEAERFAGGQKIAEIFGSRFSVALMMPGHTITKLGELTALNRGARFLVTACEDEALSWLRGVVRNIHS